MSKRKERVKQRWLHLYMDIEELFDTLEFELFTEWKDIIQNQLIKIIKKHNVLAWYGKEWKVLVSIDPIFNTYIFDVRTVIGNWRVIKIQYP